MSSHCCEVLWELCNEAAYIKVGINSVRESEVISLCQDLDAMGEVALPPYALLEGG